jgi:transcriptional regulator with XRE-family HTH domain
MPARRRLPAARLDGRGGLTGGAPRAGDREPRRATPAGALLQRWRRTRRLSQLALAHEAGVSPRHLCFLETGRARPSREMIHRLAETLAVPLRERNELLVAAGFAPTYREGGLDLSARELAPVRAALDAILRQQEPFPAVVMNRQWDVLEKNAAAARFFAFLLADGAGDPAGAGAPANVLRLMLAPDGLRPHVLDWAAAAAALVARVHREAVGGVLDEATRRVLDEVLAYPGVPERWRSPPADDPPLPVIPITFVKGGLSFRYFSTVTTLGTPQDVSLQELRIECFFPLDAATRGYAEQLAAGES